MHVLQLVGGVPRLVGPERIHLAKGAEEGEEGSEDGEPGR